MDCLLSEEEEEKDEDQIEKEIKITRSDEK